MPDAATRPRAVTIASTYLVVGSVVLLWQLVTVISAWGSTEVQEILRRVLPSGVSVEDAMGWRPYLYVPVAMAIAIGVLAVFVARGDRGSRLPLTVLSALAFVVLPFLDFSTLFIGGVMLGSAVTLWTGAAKRWFDGLPPLERERSAKESVAAAPSTSEPARSTPAPTPTAVSPDRRPRAVDIAAVLALTCSLVVAAGIGLLLLLVAVGDETLTSLREAQPEGLSPASLEDIDTLRAQIPTLRDQVPLYVVLLALAAIAAAAAIGTLLRRPVAYRVLLAASVSTILVTPFTSVAALPFAIAAAVTLLQLLRPEVRAWFATPGDDGHGPSVGRQ